MNGLIFGNSKVTHHCAREKETGLEAVATDVVATPDNQMAAAFLVQSCIGICKRVCPAECELRQLAGLDDDQLHTMLRLEDL